MAIAVLSLTGTSGSNGTAQTGVTITQPGSLVDDAVMILVIGTNNGASATGSQAKNTDATWTRLVTGEDTATANCGISVFRRHVPTAAGEPANYAFSFVQFSDDTTSQTVSYGWTLTGFSGVDTATPEDVATPATIGSASSSTTNTPAITTVTDNAWVAAAAVCDITSATWVAPTGYGNLVSVATGRSTAMAGLLKTPAGTAAAITFTNTAGGPGVGAKVALRPGGAAAPLPPGLGPDVGERIQNHVANMAAMMR